MNYSELNDNELVYLSNENNEEATNLLVSKYKNVIINTIKEYKTKYNVIGLEMSDLYQEGLIGLLTAIETFDKERDNLFYTYACICIRTSIMTVIRKTFRNKNRILNNSYSLDLLYEENTSLYESIKDEENNPDKILINKENSKELIGKIEKNLSKSEKDIFELKLKGLTNAEISVLLDKDKKQIENALFRISKKARELL